MSKQKINYRVSKVPKIEEKPKIERKVEVVSLSKFQPPKLKYVQDEAGLVFIGTKNDIYEELIKYKEESPTNGAIIEGNASYIAGRGINIVRSDNEASDKVNIEKLFPFSEVFKISTDFATFGEGAFLVMKNSDKEDVRLNRCLHIERDILTPFVNEKGEIIEYWADPKKKWTDRKSCDVYKVFDPATARSTNETEIVVIKGYQSGRNYISLPRYIAGLNYAILESKIAIYSVNHISRGFSAGWIVNFNNGTPLPDAMDEIEKSVKEKFTGEENAGTLIISFNNNQETATTVKAIEQNTSHKQWEFWTGEARTQIMVAHRVTSPLLFGIREGSGLGSNSEELETSLELYMGTVIRPIQLLFLSEFKKVLGVMEINGDIDFVPLLEFTDAKTKEDDNVSLSADKNMEKAQEAFTNELIKLGEDEDLESYDLVGVSVVEDPNDMQDVNNVNLAKTFASFWKWASEQDNGMFKVRYAYAPNQVSENSRDFCVKMIDAGKVYRKEDIVSAETKVVNKGFGMRGADTYSIWLYKGGVNCKHFWERRIYLKKNNKKITVNEARKMLSEIDPSEREKYRLQVNDPRVAQIAEEKNNFWRVSRFFKNSK